MLEKYQFLSTDWLLFGKGIMYKDSRMQTLFDESKPESTIKQHSDDDIEAGSQFEKPGSTELLKTGKVDSMRVNGNTSVLTRIVWFYEDKSFEEYFPRK